MDQTASDSGYGELNQDSFPVKRVLRRSVKSDLSTIRTIALSPDGTYLALGFDSGLIEIRRTAGSMNAIRLFTTGAQVSSIIWHPLVRDCFIAGSTNGVIQTVILKKNQRNDTQKMFKLNNYVVTMALNHDASLLAVAFGRKVALLSNWLSDSVEDVQVSYLATRSLTPKNSLGLAQNIYFLDEYTLLVFFLHQAISFSTVHPFAAGWSLPAVDRAWFGGTALSPAKDQFITANLIDGLDLYSVPGKRWLRTHEYNTTATGPPQSRLHSVSYLNARTVVSGHTQSFLVVVRDTRRAGPARFQQIFLPLNSSMDRVTHTVITGRINNKPVIVAVNGEGRHSALYILDVLFFHSPSAERPFRQQDVPWIASIISTLVAILVLGIYFQVREASKACQKALELLDLNT